MSYYRYARHNNALGPGKFSTRANSKTEQIYFFNRNKTGTSFNSFLAAREQALRLRK